MFYSSILLAAAAFSGAVTAQSTNETGTGPQLDAGSVSIEIRQEWCRTQRSSCPIICGGQTLGGDGNNCDPNTLSYSCICADTGMSPNVSSYEQTLPAFACREWRDQCVARNPDDLDAQSDCLDVQCGERQLSDASSSTSSSESSSATASSTTSGSSEASETASSTSDDDDDDDASQTGESGAAETGDSADSAASALNLGSNYGTGFLAVGILAAFGLAL